MRALNLLWNVQSVIARLVLYTLFLPLKALLVVGITTAAVLWVLIIETAKLFLTILCDYVDMVEELVEHVRRKD